MPSVPSITINGVTRRPVISAPLTAPVRPPSAMAAKTANRGGACAFSSRAATTLHSASTEATDNR